MEQNLCARPSASSTVTQSQTSQFRSKTTGGLANRFPKAFISENWPNLNVRPEKGFNYNIGAIIAAGDFRATVDYYNIHINDIVRAGTTAQLIHAARIVRLYANADSCFARSPVISNHPIPVLVVRSSYRAL